MILLRRSGWFAFALIPLVGCFGTTSTPEHHDTAPAKGSPEAGKGQDKNVVKPLPIEPAPSPEAPKGAGAEKLTDEEIALIKKLPPEDQKIAMEQVTCPVSGGHLGDPEMGVPIKQTIGDRTFFICCGGCKGDVKNKPQEVLAKLKK